MISDSLNILFSFCLFSILGWVLEVSYRSLRDRRFVNPGLLTGPYLILYGAGALILMGCVSLVHESNFLVKIFVYFAATTGLELISGLNAQHFFNVRLWDYSDQRFQFKGHICLKFSIYWVILAFAFEYLVLPLYHTIAGLLPPITTEVSGILLLAVMIVDFAMTVRRRLNDGALG